MTPLSPPLTLPLVPSALSVWSTLTVRRAPAVLMSR
jgi:hypothetical protein